MALVKFTTCTLFPSNCRPKSPKFCLSEVPYATVVQDKARFTRRYTLRSRGKAKAYGVRESQLPLLSPRYNIAPSQPVPVVLERKHGRELALLKWGLVPSWSKEANESGGGLINARAETLERKPSFAESFENRDRIPQGRRQGFIDFRPAQSPRVLFHFSQNS